jgi:hypothetical protein
VFPILAGGGLLTWVIVHAARNGGSFTVKDWLFQVVLMGGLGLALMLGLPVVGLTELRKRRRAQLKPGRDQRVGDGETRS